MIEDMIKFCGKCGELRDETTGLCPNCDAVRIAEGSVQMKKWEEKGKSQRKGGSFWKGFLGFVFGAVSLIILVCGAVKSLEYFNIIDISDDSALLESVRVKEDNTELDSKHTQFKNISGTCITRSINNEEDALAAIDDLSEVLGINNVNEEFGECKTDNVLSNSYYRYEQKYKGIPVYGRSMSVSADSDGKCLLITGNYFPFEDIDTEIDFNEDDAKKLLQDSYENVTYLQCNGLTIYSLNDTLPEQAWSFYVNDSGIMKNVFISTASGEILAEIVLTYTDSVECSGVDVDNVDRKFTAEKENGLYVLHDVNKGISIYDANNSTLEVEVVVVDSNGNVYRGTDEGYIVDKDGNIVEVNEESYPVIITDKSGKQIGKDAEYAVRLKTMNIFTELKPVINKEAVWSNKKAVTLMADISAIYDFWYSTFQREGFDGNHGEIIAVYDDYMNYEEQGWYIFGNTTNAYSTLGAYGFPITVLSFGTDNSLEEDVIGHEYMHSIERSISGMVYQGETGALMEAYSDIFGEISQDLLDDSQLNDSCDWIHDSNSDEKRNMMTPSYTSCPDTYRGTNWINTYDVSKDNDNGGVHKNSTVISHTAYLMWTGMGGKNSAYESLSTGELAKLFYTALFSLPSDCTFSQFRYVLQNTADILCEQRILTNKQRLCVYNAMFQVGISSEPVTYTVVDDFELCTYDVNNQLYDDYTISVSEMDVENMPQGPAIKPSRKEAVVYQVRTSEPYEMLLKPGTYEITLTDNKNYTEEYAFHVSVTSDGKKTVSVGTNFGMESEVDLKDKSDSSDIPAGNTAGGHDIESKEITADEWELLKKQASALAMLAQTKDAGIELNTSLFYVWMDDILPVVPADVVDMDPRKYISNVMYREGNIYKINLNDYEWMHNNVLNIDYKGKDILEKASENQITYFEYEDNESLYYYDWYEGDSWAAAVNKIETYSFLDDGKVYVNISLYDYWQPMYTMNLYLIGEVLEREGTKYWSFYDISLSPLTEKEEYADILDSASVAKKEKYVLLSRVGYALINYSDFVEKVEMYDIYEYGEAGNLIKTESIQIGENSVSKYGYEFEYEYDKEMNLIEKQYFFYREISDEEYPDKEREQVVSDNLEHKYNKEGERIETKSIDPETGEVSYKSEYSYEYNNMGNIIKTISYDGEGISYISEYQYDNRGYVSESKHVSGYGEGEWIYEDIYKHEYDSRGNLIKTVRYYESGNSDSTEYEYDRQNNMTKLTVYDTDGKEIQKYEYTYGYIPISAENTYGQVDWWKRKTILNY